MPFRMQASLKGQSTRLFYWFFFHQLFLEELLVFVIDSPVYLPLWSRDSPVSPLPGIRDSPVVIILGSRSNWCTQNLLVQDSPVINLWVEVLLPGLFITRSFFLQAYSDACSNYTKKSTPWCIHHRGVFWTLGSRFTDFKKNTTIFKGTLILKIHFRLL